MFDLTISTIERHQRFIRRVVASGEVWVLQLPDDSGSWATSHGTFINEDDGTEVDVPIVPFWSDRAYAARCATGPWPVYRPRAIALDDFIGCVLQDMHRKDVMAGTNWNGDFVGDDMDAIDLARELSDALDREADATGDST